MAIGYDTIANSIQSPKRLNHLNVVLRDIMAIEDGTITKCMSPKTLGSFERFTLLAFPAIVPSTVGITEMKLSHL